MCHRSKRSGRGTWTLDVALRKELDPVETPELHAGRGDAAVRGKRPQPAWSTNPSRVARIASELGTFGMAAPSGEAAPAIDIRGWDPTPVPAATAKSKPQQPPNRDICMRPTSSKYIAPAAPKPSSTPQWNRCVVKHHTSAKPTSEPQVRDVRPSCAPHQAAGRTVQIARHGKAAGFPSKEEVASALATLARIVRHQ